MTDTDTAELVAKLRASGTRNAKGDGVYMSICDQAADRLTALERDLGEARARFEKHSGYSIQLQRIIEAICHGRELRPDSAELHHHKMADQFMTASKAEVERLKEALKPFARIADMEERAEPESSVIVNVSRCRDARAALQPQVGK